MSERDITNQIRGGSHSGPVVQAGQINGPVTLVTDGQPVPPYLLHAERWPTASTWNALAAGAHRARPGDDGSSVPPYIARDIDEQLRARLTIAANHGGLVLIIGDSTAGKSRAAFEAMVTAFPERHVLAPSSGSHLPLAIEAITHTKARCLVWLDDLEAFLSPGALDEETLSEFERLHVPILATMRTRQFEIFSSRIQLEPTQHLDIHTRMTARVGARVLGRAEPILLSRTWSESELHRARAHGDSRIVEAVAHHGPYGVAEYLAAGPALWSEWQRSAGIDGHPRGFALVAAAVDLARTGLPSPYERRLLIELHGHYLSALGGPALRPESIDDAMQWATQVRLGVTSLLIPAPEDTLHVFDYIVDQVDNITPHATIPDFIWPYALSNVEDKVALMSVGINAAEAATHESQAVAEHAFKSLIADSAPMAAYNLGVLYVETDRVTEAKDVFRKAAESGDAAAAFNLGVLFEQEGNKEESQRWNRQAAERGFARAQFHLGLGLSKEGRGDEAEEWYRRAAEAGSSKAACNLGNLLNNSGRFDEALQWYRVAAEAGDHHAAFNLGVHFSNINQDDESERWFRFAAEQGSSWAAFNLGCRFSRRGQIAEAEEWYSRSFVEGYSAAAYNLGMLLERSERSNDAESWYRRGAQAGCRDSILRLGLILAVDERPAEAEEWLRKAADMGDTDAANALGELLPTLGKFDQAVPYLKIAAEANYPDAAYNLGAAFAKTGRLRESKKWYYRAAEAGDAEAARNLGMVFIEEGRADRARRWFHRAAESGDSEAALLLFKSVFLEEE
ncbi:tetratricopeptide repeat protein [Streptomyces sp. CY1]|uniref:tetratricopeptide repeat protein n=1 Tax=Streptomyces sp. CY1 TaxID=3388313 RepID=UPI0039A18ACB